MLFFLFPLLALAADFATVSRVRGTVTSGGHALALKAGLAEGSVVSAGDDGFAQLSLADDSVVHVARNTTVELRRSGPTPLLSLAAGKLRAVVKKAASGTEEKLIVTTKTAVLGIRGTDFTVAYDANTQVTSLVTVEGSVAMVAMVDGKKPAELLSGTATMVAAGSYSLLAPRALADISSAESSRPGAAAKTSGAPAALSQSARPEEPASAPTPPKKVPSYFLESVKKEDDAFVTVDPQGNVQVQHTPK